MPQITKVNVSVLRAALPSIRQEKAFLISAGATTLNPGETAILRSVADLKNILGTSTTKNEVLKADYGKLPVAIPTGQITEADKENTAESEDTPQFTSPDELNDMVASWFANSSLSVSVLECGPSPALPSKTISTFLENYPEGAYAFILPRGAAIADTGIVQLANNNAYNDSQLYFIFTEKYTDDGKGTFTNPLIPTGGNGAKSVILASGEVAQVGSGQHLGAAIGSQFLGYKPTAAQKLTGLSYRELVGITPMDSTQQATQAQTATMDAANVNYPYSASTQGSARGTILFRGLCLNGDGAEQWYGTDFTAINAQNAVNNAIIEGNQPGNTPVGYDPFGVRALKNAAQVSCNNDLAVGVATLAKVTAEDLATYLKENPADYASKTYNGLTLEVTPFESIRTVTINLKADFSGASLAA